MSENNNFLYRDHRGTLEESMETAREFSSAEDLEAELREKYTYLVGDIRSSLYAVDERIDWDTHLVLIGGGVVGMTNKHIEFPNKA
jgi:hypothetical protein